MIKISSQMLMFMPLALMIGIAMTIQTAINSQLSERLHSPLQAGLLSFLVGSLILAVLVIFQSSSKPSFDTLLQLPWYLWLGGCLGVYAISMSIYTAPKLSFLTFSGLLIFGQILMSALLDQFGWLGIEKTPMNWQRVVGAILIFIGVVFTLQR